MRITFLIPDDNRSGAVRVTATLAERLRRKGYPVRLLLLRGTSVVAKIRRLLRKSRFLGRDGWLHLFGGEIESSREARLAHFEPNELAIAVGTYVVEQLSSLDSKVAKLRYNHGLPRELDPAAKRAWSLDLPTITVSSTLVPRLEELAPNTCLGVVPNGVEHSLYYDMKLGRLGIGTFFSSHPNKAPEFIIEVLQEVHRRFPDVPIYVVSTEKCPAELRFANFYRYPSVSQVRKIYSMSKLWLLLSDAEGLPGPVLEALCCGTPVISTDNLGSLEIISHLKNGLIIPRRNVPEALKAITLALNDEQLQKRLSNEGLNRALEFSWESATVRMEAVLRGIARPEINR